jgi:multidrug efflux system membrane fusion protein
MKRLILAAAIALVLVASLPRGGSAAPPLKPASPAATVSIGTATETALAPTRWVPGSVMSRDDSRIASAAAGRVVEIVEVGTAVKAGQRLAKLDDVSLHLKLDEARAQAGHARAQRELAATQFGRLDKLAPGNGVAQTQLDESRAQRQMAEQDLASAEARARSIEHDMAETEIRAPFDGVVSERFAQRGEFLQIGAPVVHVVDTGHLEAKVLAPLALAPRIQVGQEVNVRLAGQTQPLKVRAVVPVGDEHSRQFELRVALPSEFALVGTPVDVAVPEDAGTAAITVPRDALVLRESRTYVMRVKADNTAEQVEVSPGAARDSRVEVRGDLHAGDRVVVRGAERLSPGQSVSVVEPG